jgi:hypothetical protein
MSISKNWHVEDVWFQAVDFTQTRLAIGQKIAIVNLS